MRLLFFVLLILNLGVLVVNTDWLSDSEQAKEPKHLANELNPQQITFTNSKDLNSNAHLAPLQPQVPQDVQDETITKSDTNLIEAEHADIANQESATALDENESLSSDDQAQSTFPVSPTDFSDNILQAHSNSTLTSIPTPPESTSTIQDGNTIPNLDNVSDQVCVVYQKLSMTEADDLEKHLKELNIQQFERLSPKVKMFWVYIPPFSSREAADQVANLLKTEKGIRDLFVVNNKGPYLNAISLGVFSREVSAQKMLENLKQKGITNARSILKPQENNIRIKITASSTIIQQVQKTLNDTVIRTRCQR